MHSSPAKIFTLFRNAPLDLLTSAYLYIGMSSRASTQVVHVQQLGGLRGDGVQPANQPDHLAPIGP